MARLNGLEGLLDSPSTRAVSPFKPDQWDLVQEKLKYGREEKLGLYLARFHEAGRIDDATFNKLKPLAFPGNPLYIPNNSVLVEYDSVLNQMLIYMHIWQIPENNPFYKKLREYATGAYEERAAAPPRANP